MEYKEITTEKELESFIDRSKVDGVNLNFYGYIFNIDFVYRGDLNIVIFENCIFNKRFTIAGRIFGSSLMKNCIFRDIVDLSNTTFRQNARFHASVFEKIIRFNNVKFEDLADFWASKFYQKTVFYKTDFHEITVFSSTLFKENVLFTYTLLEKEVVFRGAKFEKGLDLALAILSGNINLFDIELNNYKSCKDIDDENDYDKSVSFDAIIPHKNKRETFRILKKELMNQGNSIDSLKFASLEKMAFQTQLKANLFSDKIKWYKILQDQFILWMGKCSNRHGESWFRGVVFTLTVGFLFFYLSLISTKSYSFCLCFDWSDFKESMIYYTKFLLPTHNSDYMEGLKPEFSFYIWDFIGRIFVSFGIYQTVVSFRKYHTK